MEARMEVDQLKDPRNSYKLGLVRRGTGRKYGHKTTSSVENGQKDLTRKEDSHLTTWDVAKSGQKQKTINVDQQYISEY